MDTPVETRFNRAGPFYPFVMHYVMHLIGLKEIGTRLEGDDEEWSMSTR